jgi:polyhydroxybutyrate depolymerase
MKHFFLFIFFISNLVYCQFEAQGWHKNVTLLESEKLRYFDLYRPKNCKLYPELLIQLHGGTQSKDDVYSNNGGASKYWKDIADANGFILVVPNGTNLKTGITTGENLNWNDCRTPLPNDYQANDVLFISNLIDFCINKYNVNSKRVYVTGVSNGGFMSYRLALEIPDKITAIAAFNANFSKLTECIPVGKPISVMIVNGTSDTFIPFDGGITSFKKEAIFSSEETVQYWLKINNLSEVSPIVTTILDKCKNDKSTILLKDYKKEKNSFSVSYAVVNGGGHVMPGMKYSVSKFIQKIVGKQNQDIEGAELAWNFFKNISR